MLTSRDTIRILFVEDLTSDYELAVEILTREGLKVETQRVQGASEMRTALDTFKPNVVVSDYSMPQFDGMTALKITLEYAPHIPFIMLTGSMNEQTAVECMKAGATDYVIKERIKRLPFAINEALEKSRLLLSKRKAEQALILSEERFRRLAENVQDIIFRFDFLPHHHFAYVSPSIKKITGYSPDEYYSNPNLFNEIVHPDDSALIGLNRVDDVKKFIKPIAVRCIKKDGTQIWVELVTQYMFNNKGDIAKIEGVARDITERKIAEEALKESEERYSDFMDSSFDIAYIKDENLKYVMINRPGLQNLRKKEEEVLGKTDFDLINPKLAQSCQRTDKEAIEKKSLVISFETTDNKIFETRKFPLKLSGGKIGVGCYIRDVTEIQKAQVAIRNSEEKYRELVENSLTGIYTTNLEGDFLFANHALCNIFQFNSTKDLISADVKTIYKNPSDRDRFIQAILKYKKLFNYELEVLTAKGNPISVLVSAVLSGDNISGMMLDITDRKQAERELLHKKQEIESQIEEYRALNEELFLAKEKAEESDKLKTAFLQNLSHEIRTPMNGIIGFTQLLKIKHDNPEMVTQYLDLIESSGERLMNLISDLVDISRIETGQMSYNPEEFDINSVLSELELLFCKQADEKGLAMVLTKYLPENEKVVYSDKGIIYQILSNLIKNAIKFTESGSIEFGCTKRAGTFEFFVKDTGIGVEPEKTKLIFERFSQGDTSITRGYEGAGLGLPISQAFVENLGGGIWVESKLHEGSSFYFTIPENKI